MERIKFPKAILVILDDDLLRSLSSEISESTNLSLVLYKMLKHLVNEFRKAIETRKDQLPDKLKKLFYPKVYWVEAPQHRNFPNNFDRRKFNSTLQSNTSSQANMQIMRMKKVWDPEDFNLFQNNRYTSRGLMRYWESIDNALEFNKNFKKESRVNQFPRRDRSKFFWSNKKKADKQNRQEKEFDQRECRRRTGISKIQASEVTLLIV